MGSYRSERIEQVIEGSVIAPAAVPEEDSTAVTIELLGAFAVRVGTRLVEPAEWRLQKARSLVKLLALAGGHRLPRDRVVDLLWPDLDPSAANNNLYQTMHSIRRALRLPPPAQAIGIRQGIVWLLPDGDLAVDVDAFEAGITAARRSDDLTLYHDALALYRGDLLPEDLYEDWAAWHRERLKETYIATLLDVARRHEARGELRMAMDLLNRAVEADPLREDAHTGLMRLYASTGQRGRALRQFRELREALATELDAEPDEDNRKMHEAIVAGRYGDADGAAAEEALAAPRHNLPLALTSFIGRRQELDDIARLLRQTRLLTLVGVGGAGKTRLALRAGWNLLTTYRDGVWVIQLASLSDPERLPRLVAGTLGLEDESEGPIIDRIIDRLRGDHALLILDNCEHLPAACRDLSFALLSRCPELQILATSRTRLGLTGEMALTVNPLAHPPVDDLSLQELAGFDAVQLFVERARFRQPAFSLTPATAPGIQRICSLVEGIPLAVELAASRVGTLGVDHIAARLAESGELLSTDDRSGNPRHHNLAATLDWSYSLLEPAAQTLFRRLAVFSGGWTIEDAEQFIGDDLGGPGAVLELLSRLADSSLVVVEGASEGTVRYRLLEPVRQHAQRLLRTRGAESEARRRHALVYLQLAEQAGPELRGAQARRWFARIDANLDNIRAAFRWTLDGPGGIQNGLRVAGVFWRYWFSRGHLNEGREITRKLLIKAEAEPDIDPGTLAAAYNAAGAMAFYQTDEEEALAHYRQSLRLRRQIGDQRGTAATLSNIGLVLKDQGEHAAAIDCFEESRRIFAALEDTRGLGSTLGNIGILYQELGDLARAQSFLEESLALIRVRGDAPMTTLNNLGALAIEQGDYPRARALLEESLAASIADGVKRSQAAALLNLGHVAREQGDLDRGLACYREGLTIARDLGESVLTALALEGIAALLTARGDLTTAATLLHVAAHLRQTVGTPLSPIEHRRVDAILSAIREHGGAAIAPATLPVADAVALALGELPMLRIG
jgi:predicted ATPase/DNA-binding SARP family transcriptional activator